jgi:hypothetical protein
MRTQARGDFGGGGGYCTPVLLLPGPDLLALRTIIAVAPCGDPHNNETDRKFLKSAQQGYQNPYVPEKLISRQQKSSASCGC